jgi:phosphoribosylformylglycinamidine synthase
MTNVNTLVLTGYGLNCDCETAHAFEMAGAKAHRIHINALIDGSVNLSRFQIMAFGGGFSWGDDHGAGVIQAVRMRTNLGNQMLEFIAQGKLIIGICNGFQTLVNLGLLPAIEADYQRRSVALTYNDCGNFRDQWVTLKINPKSACIFTRGLLQLDLPVRHGEGKFWADGHLIQHLIKHDQVVLQYALPDGRPANQAFPFNPNGSLSDIAGICDPSGRVFGLMPHPEAYHHWTNHPDWTRIKEINKRRGLPLGNGQTPALAIFQNAVAYFRDR